MRSSTQFALGYPTCAVLLGYLSYDSYADRQTLASGSQTNAAIVTFHNCSPCGRWDSNYYVIDLMIDGVQIRSSLDKWSWHGPRTPGSLVRVRYALKDPTYYVQDAELPISAQVAVMRRSVLQRSWSVPLKAGDPRTHGRGVASVLPWTGSAALPDRIARMRPLTIDLAARLTIGDRSPIADWCATPIPSKSRPVVPSVS